MNIFEVINEMDPATLKNAGVMIALAVGAIVVGVGAIVGIVSFIWKSIKAVMKAMKAILCCAIFLGIGYTFTTSPPAMEKVEEVKEIVVDHIK